MKTLTLKRSERKLDNPADFTYDCQNEACANNSSRTHLKETGIDLPDSEFPQRAEVQDYGLDPEICLQCHGVTLV